MIPPQLLAAIVALSVLMGSGGAWYIQGLRIDRAHAECAAATAALRAEIDKQNSAIEAQKLATQGADKRRQDAEAAADTWRKRAVSGAALAAKMKGAASCGDALRQAWQSH